MPANRGLLYISGRAWGHVMAGVDAFFGTTMATHEKIGEFLLRIDAMTEEQCEDVLRRQAGGDTRLFGEIARELGYVDRRAIERFLSLA